jgi:hypothetical protein
LCTEPSNLDPDVSKFRRRTAVDVELVNLVNDDDAQLSDQVEQINSVWTKKHKFKAGGIEYPDFRAHE